MIAIRWTALLLWLAMAMAVAQPCDEIGPHGQAGWGLLEDPDQSLTVEQVAKLPITRFRSLDAALPLSLTHSAIWLHLPLHNDSAEAVQCRLTLGEPRLENLRVYLPTATGWEILRAGSDYPLDEWAVRERQPAFPVTLRPGEQRLVLARVTSANSLLVSPRVWSEGARHAERQHAYFLDGIALGIVILVVPFSLLVGVIVGSRLLLFHASAIGSYAVLTCLLNGYLLYWPGALPWSRELIATVAALSFVAFLAYFRELLRTWELSRWVDTAFALLLGSYIAANAYSVWFDAVDGRDMLLWLLRAMYPVVIASFCWGVWRGLRYNWLVWLVVGSLTAQCLARYVLRLEALPWQSQSTYYSLSSTLGGVFLLTCTLVMVVKTSRQREQAARVALEHQRLAEQERLEQTVALRTEQLNAALRARSTLLARISHDLRSPLVAILDHARLLREQPEPAHIHRIERHARQQLELIDELTEFSRDSLKQIEIEPIPGYIHAFLKDLAQEGTFLAQRHNNHVVCRIADDLPSLVHADFRRLRQVLLNLLGNAAKFTHDGTVELCVEVRAVEADIARLRFEVRDSGIGIDAWERDKVLLPFQRGSNVGRVAGSGLGLSIVTQLLDAMGSELSVESNAGVGSCFGFELVLQTANEEAMDAVFVERHVEVEGEQRQLLLVDDQPGNRIWLTDLLNGYGFQAVAVANGVEALQVLQSMPVDLVLCDQMMPTMDGWELLRHVREGWPDLPVILYSAAPPRMPQGLEGLAFDATLLKPADSADLLERIDSLTRHRVTTV
ncbi:hybrid sensor histidine kinase/response regulator [Pseudomonas entomophila]|uniref:hybrid sensor histidine kinase/response regulator n=1 Tax=Pseudomonas entomophila TaxID=312306 RepID=UPI003EB90E96